MDIAFYSIEEALNFKKEHEVLIGKHSKYVKSKLRKIIIMQMTSTEFGQMWAKQDNHFDTPDISKIISDKEFEEQLKAFDYLDLTKKEDCFYQVLGVFVVGN